VAANQIQLDNIISALTWALPQWTPALKQGQARDVLRLLVCKLYGASHGNLFGARIQASQASLAASCGISREWCNKLLARLVAEGWIQSYAPRLPDGRYLPCLFRPGGQLKRLLYVLLRYRRPRHSRVNSPSQSLPSKDERERSLTFWRTLRAQLAAKLGHGTRQQR
jgi:hypothetical protein